MSEPDLDLLGLHPSLGQKRNVSMQGPGAQPGTLRESLGLPEILNHWLSGGVTPEP
jgi:hypothetical protein